MKTIESSRHFKKRCDPGTNAACYVLRTHVAAQQQTFYFVNPSMTDDCRYLWFYCSFPPAMYRTLGLLDLELDEVRHFPETEFIAGPLVDLLTGDVLFGGHQGFFVRSPKPSEPLRKICDVPAELSKYGAPSSLGTHLTYSPDKKEIFVDARSGDRFIAGSLEIDSGKFTTWREWDYCRNHAQFNPVDRDLVLMAEDHFIDRAENRFHPIRCNENNEFMRLWTVRRGGGETMHPPLDAQRATHEWWSADGQKIYYCRYTLEHGNNAVVRLDLAAGRHEVAAPVRAWHAFTSKDESFLVYDENGVFYRGTPSKVALYDMKTGKNLYIISHQPALAPKDRPSPYHLDPHPQLVGGERYVAFTTSVNGRADVALAPLAPLLDRTR